MTGILYNDEYKSIIKSGVHGENFQNEIALALFLRMREYSSPSRLAYEMDDGDKFDDIVLFDDGKKEIHFLQVKHADVTDNNIKNVTVDGLLPKRGKSKSDFDLSMYLKSYQTVKQKFETEDYVKKFYVFTNKNLLEDQKLKEMFESVEHQVNEILQFPGSRHLKLMPTKKAIKELGGLINKDIIEIKDAIKLLFDSEQISKILIDYRTALKEVLSIKKIKKSSSSVAVSLRNKKEEEKTRYSVSLKTESQQVNVVKLLGMLAEDKFDRNKEVTVDNNFLLTDSRNNMLPTITSDDEIIYFFKHCFSLSVNQPNDLRPVIDSEIRKWMKTCVHPDIVGKLGKSDFDNVFSDLKEKFCTLNKSDTRKMKTVLKPTDIKESLQKILDTNNTIKCTAEADGLQHIYINRTIIYRKAAEEPTVNISDHKFAEEFRGIFKDHQFIVLVGDPGMGKTMLIRFLAFEAQKRHKFDVFTVYFSSIVENLQKITDFPSFLRGILSKENYKFIVNIPDIQSIHSGVLSEENCSVIGNSPKGMNINVQTECVNYDKRKDDGYSLILMIDGFDEIPSKFNYKVINWLKELTSKKSIQIFITSRSSFKTLLETRFKVTSMFLEPFSKDNQLSYWRQVCKVSDDAEKSFESLLNRLQSSIPSNLSGIFHLPLMMRMLGDIYSNNLIHEINIVNLLEQFVIKCWSVKLLEKRKFTGSSNEPDHILEHQLFNEYILKHQLLAKKLLNVMKLKNLSNNPQSNNHWEIDLKKSLLVEVVSDKVKFFNVLFSEYFIAKYICENIAALTAELVFSILSQHEVVRRLVMIKMGETTASNEILNNLCKNKWIFSLWACESGYLANVSPDNLKTMLQNSVRNGNVHKDVAQLLIDNNYDVEAVDENEWTALHLAARHGNDTMIELLLRNGAKVDAESKDKWTALHLAAGKGHQKVVELLVRKRANVNARAENKEWTALHFAAKKGYFDVVDLLLQYNAEANAENKDKCTALHFASEAGNETIVDLLLQRKAKVEAQNQNTWTALHLASQNGHSKVVDVLLRHKANVNAQTQTMWTALHLAAGKGHQEVVDLLVRERANVNARADSKQWTALHFAAKKGYFDVVDLLLQYNAEANAENKDKCTALHFASEAGNETIVVLLLQRKAKVEAQNQNTWTALHLASQNGHSKVVDVLLRHKANVNAQTQTMWTALHLAVQSGHVQVIELLLSNRANTKSRTIEGHTALTIAEKKGYRAVIKLLKH